MGSPGKKSFLLRVDPALWAEVERLAADELRSANAQVEYLLRDALQRRGRRVAGATAHSAAATGAEPPARAAPGASDAHPRPPSRLGKPDAPG